MFSALMPNSSKLSLPLILATSGSPILSLADITPLLMVYSPLNVDAAMLFKGKFRLMLSFPVPATFKPSVNPDVTSLTGLVLMNVIPLAMGPSVTTSIFSA